MPQADDPIRPTVGDIQRRKIRLRNQIHGARIFHVAGVVQRGADNEDLLIAERGRSENTPDLVSGSLADKLV